MPDKRKRPRIAPPTQTNYNPIATTLDAEDYRKFYEVVLTRGASGAEALRLLIREEYERIYSDDER